MKVSRSLIRSTLVVQIISGGILSSSTSRAMAGGVSITNYGHSALLIKGSGKSVLTNPFKAVGCATGLKEPKMNTDVILASSRLPDEGAEISKGAYLTEPGSYRIKGLNLEGVAIPHDRLGGRRFGKATIWRWEQGGLTFAHLGGSAGPLTGETKVLIGRPDVLIIGVGGSAKVYNGIEAAAIVKELNPKQVIPVQYAKNNSASDCDQKGIEPFLEAMEGIPVKKTGRTLVIPERINDKTVINILK